MKHRKTNTSTFGLKYGPRKALMRNLVSVLVDKERIKTTLPKARAIKPIVEKAITLGRKGSLHARRILLTKYPNKNTVSKIMNHLSPRFQNRPGGYTRIIKLGLRKGDQAKKVFLEFVDYTFTPKPSKEEKAKQKASKEFQKTRRLTARKLQKQKKTFRSLQRKARHTQRTNH